MVGKGYQGLGVGSSYHIETSTPNRQNNRQTDRIENITLFQTMYTDGN